MSRPVKMPVRTFDKMNADTIAKTTEDDIKSLARKWKYRHPKSSKEAKDKAATETAALYLQANQFLYARDDIQAMRNAHENWMLLMRTQFLSVFEPKIKV